MSRSQYSLAWDSFKTNICGGFSALQQNGEFVDMTLAADGHFVKVHQVIVALSSPYLKNLMASAPCQHPVIFLNNVSHKVLSFLLEYIYTGEVIIPPEYLASFTNAAKELHIKGLESINNHSIQSSVGTNLDAPDFQYGTGKRKIPTGFDQTLLPPTAKKIFIKPEGAEISVNQNLGTDDMHDYGDMIDDSGAQNDDDDDDQYRQNAITSDGVDADQIKANPSNLLYTVSIRGSLQVILNRYMYNLNSTTSRTGVRRWRCVDYRNNKCNAYLVTKGNLVVNRSHLHNHPFHDKKILAKIEMKAVFSAIDDVEAYRKKEKEREDEDKIEDNDE